MCLLLPSHFCFSPHQTAYHKLLQATLQPTSTRSAKKMIEKQRVPGSSPAWPAAQQKKKERNCMNLKEISAKGGVALLVVRYYGLCR